MLYVSRGIWIKSLEAQQICRFATALSNDSRQFAFSSLFIRLEDSKTIQSMELFAGPLFFSRLSAKIEQKSFSLS
jgi:hypothetical protein